MRVATPRAVSRLDPWLPPFVLMGVIFLLSAQPNLNTGLGTIDFVGRKIAHFSEYALLCFLWWRALRTVAATRTALVCAVAISVLYACTDEYHQTFVHGRHGRPLDVLIDSAGAATAALAVNRRRR
jgi:VanZ family protein